MTIIKPSTAFKAGADWVSAEVRAYIKDQVATHVDTVADVRNSDFEQTRFVYVRSKATLYRLDLSSGAADDGDTVLRDNVGRRYVKVPGSDGAKTWNVQVDDLTARAAYDDEDPGFVVLVSDTGDGRAALYTMGDGGSGDWIGPAYQTGPAGGPGPAGEGFNLAGQWDNATTYSANDTVWHDGRTFASKVDGNIGNEPPGSDEDDEYWQFVPAAQGPKGEKGDKGDKGDTGPAWDGWQGEWVTSIVYDKLDTVERGGSSYICTSAHTSGSTTEPGVGADWQTVWDLVAAKGQDGAGTGDVVGPASSTAGRLAAFKDTTGKEIEDSGKSVSDFATAAQGAKADAALPKSGGTMTGGLSFGSSAASSATDLTRHIALFGTQYGFTVTASNLNYTSAHSHSFYSGTNLRGKLDNTGNWTVSGKVTVGAGPTADMDAATKQYVDDGLAPTVKKDADGSLTAGYTATAVDDGTKSSGTYTPSPAGGNIRKIVNGGAFTLAAPSASGDYTMIIQITNNSSAGAITLSGFTKSGGDSFTTTDGHDFLIFITKANGFTHAQVVALQ